jgi:hypothetical protein
MDEDISRRLALLEQWKEQSYAWREEQGAKIEAIREMLGQIQTVLIGDMKSAGNSESLIQKVNNSQQWHKELEPIRKLGVAGPIIISIITSLIAAAAALKLLK